MLATPAQEMEVIVGIMQPYFFPYPGYFDLINYADTWIVFDSPQYIRHGWINRNRILKPSGGWQYIVVPIKKHARNAAILDIRVNDDIDWRTRILGQIQHYKKKAPYFNQTEQLLRDCFTIQESSIARLNAKILEKTCQHLGIDFVYEFSSQIDFARDKIGQAGDWALQLAQKTGANEYVNPAGGAHLFNADDFVQAGIRLTLRNRQPLRYPCRGYEFTSSLSIIDALMWNEPQAIKDYLNAEP